MIILQGSKILLCLLHTCANITPNPPLLDCSEIKSLNIKHSRLFKKHISLRSSRNTVSFISCGVNWSFIFVIFEKHRFSAFLTPSADIHLFWHLNQSLDFTIYYMPLTLHEKCPNTEFFLVLIFPHSISPYSVRMRENTDQKKLCIWTLFTQCNKYPADNSIIW